MSRTWLIRFGVIVVVLLFAGQAIVAEDIEKKWRLGFSLGGYNTQDDVESDAANRLFIVDENELLSRILSDPRSDDAALGTLSIEPAPRFLGSVQYAVNKIFVIEAAVGYHKGDVGDVEVQAQFTGTIIPDNRNFLFTIHRLPVGEIEQIPIQLSAMARFRPRANFNPFLGAGVGYTLVGFEPSAQLNDLSAGMDASLGSYTELTSLGTDLVVSSTIEDLSGAEVDAPDTMEWHLLGGAEYTFKRKWAAFVELRYLFASRQFRISFNGSDSLGISVPNEIVDEGTPGANSRQYGGFLIREGGLIDGGVLYPTDPSDVPPGMTDAEFCATPGSECDFAFEPDGLPDPGVYYVKGGDIKYGGFHLGFGIRYTF